MPLTSLLAAICLGAAFASADIAGNAPTAEIKDMKALVVLPAGASDYREYRINTQSKAIQKEGGVHDVYVTRRPSKGNNFVTVTVPVSSLELMTMTGHDRVPSTPVNYVALSYGSFHWLVEEGAGEKRSTGVTNTGKATLNEAFGVPLAGRDHLLLAFKSTPR